MIRTSIVLSRGAFIIMAAFGLLGGMFVIGETFADPGGWAAVLLSALWVAPVAACSAFALLRPALASAALAAITVAVSIVTVADAVFGIVPREGWGPVTAIAVFATGVVLAFLGLHRAGRAGVLMLLLAAAQLVATVVGRGAAGGDPEAVLSTSSGVVIVPVAMVGMLFVLSGLLAHEPSHPTHAHGIHPAH